MADLNDILNGEPTEPSEPVEPVEPQDPAPSVEPEPEPITGEPSEPVTPTDPTPEPDEVKGLKAAAAAERKKRQDIEAEYQQRVAALEQQLAQRQTQEEEPYIDEDVKTLVTQTKQELQDALITQKWELSETFTREKHEDFDDKVEVFKGLMKADPNLYNRMIQQPNPAGWMYKTAADHQQMQKLKEIGDPVKYEAELTERIREQERAKILAELEAEKKQATEAAIRAKLPRTGFAEERSSGTARATPDKFNGATPMKSILG